MQILSSPFSADVESVREHIQMELSESQVPEEIYLELLQDIPARRRLATTVRSCEEDSFTFTFRKRFPL